VAPAGATCDGHGEALGIGLDHERWPIAAVPASGGDACVDLVRIDLARFKLRVLTAAHDGGARTAPDWLSAFHLAAVVNAGMFEHDNSPVGLIAVDNAELGHANPKLGGILAFAPADPADPPVVIAGKTCAGFDLGALRRRYHAIVEGYRLLDCDGAAIVWADPKHYSAAAIGVDRAGHAVVLHARAAVTMTELARALAQPGLGLTGALFVEGGPEASVIVRGDRELRLIGSYETGFHEADDNHEFWTLPNVIGAIAR